MCRRRLRNRQALDQHVLVAHVPGTELVLLDAERRERRRAYLRKYQRDWWHRRRGPLGARQA